MKKSTFFITLGLWTAVVTLGALLSEVQGAAALAAFPWTQIGHGLRALSLSGGAGNAAAVALWLLAGLLPLGAAVLLRRRKGSHPAALPLALLCPVLLAGLYAAINPGKQLSGSPALLGVVLWGCVLGCVMLALTRQLCAGERLWRAAAMTLWALAALFVLDGWGLELASLRQSLAGLGNGAADIGAGISVLPEGLLPTSGDRAIAFTRLMLAGQLVIRALPAALDVWIVATLLSALGEALNRGRYTGQAVERAEILTARCKIALTVILVSQVLFALLQLLLADRLLSMSVRISLPLAEVAFALVALVLAGLLHRGKALQDDNDLFV